MAITLVKALDNFDNVLLSSIKKSIEISAGEIFEKKKKEMIEQLDARKDEIVAGMSLKIMKFIRVENFGQNLRIEVLTDKIK